MISTLLHFVSFFLFFPFFVGFLFGEMGKGANHELTLTKKKKENRKNQLGFLQIRTKEKKNLMQEVNQQVQFSSLHTVIHYWNKREALLKICSLKF